MTKYIFVTGGVVSSLGKGLTSAAIGWMLERYGFRVSMQKLDPYINVDPGTMSPFQHGEVYVTDDGAETDLDLGHYERFTSMTASRINNTTAGRIYLTVIERDLPREYLYLCDELFMCGTAAEITPIRSVDGRQVGAGKAGPVTRRIQELFFGLFDGGTQDKYGWLEAV